MGLVNQLEVEVGKAAAAIVQIAASRLAASNVPVDPTGRDAKIQDAIHEAEQLWYQAQVWLSDVAFPQIENPKVDNATAVAPSAPAAL